MESPVPIAGESVSVRVYNPEVGELRYVKSDWAFVKLGATFIVRVDGRPVIIATARDSMILGHAKSMDLVDKIVGVFRGHGVHISEIAMCAQFATPELESEFIDRAIQAGLQRAWTMNSVERPDASYIALHRRGCYHC